MQKYFNTVANRATGLPLVGASVQVNFAVGGAATVYSDNGITIKANPIVTDANGYFEFYAADGRYSAVVSVAGAVLYTENDIVLQDLVGLYSTGTWAPSDISGGALSIACTSSKWTKIGNLVTVLADLTWPANANGAPATIGNFPFAFSTGPFGGFAVGYTNLGQLPVLFAGGGGLALVNTSGASITNAQMSGKALYFSGSYFSG